MRDGNANPGKYSMNVEMESISCAQAYILKYLRRTRDYMLVYSGEDLTPLGYAD